MGENFTYSAIAFWRTIDPIGLLERMTHLGGSVMTDEFTENHRANLVEYLAKHELSSGLGTKESACSVAAINLARTGELTDEVPDCMSEVLARAIIVLQDAMPAEMRNSTRYKAFLPHAAGTGRDREQERFDIFLDWMWSVVLPQIQPIADEQGFGPEWERMCRERTPEAANAVAGCTAGDDFAVVRVAHCAARASCVDCIVCAAYVACVVRATCFADNQLQNLELE